MKKLLLATVTSAALALPAFAQYQATPSPSPDQTKAAQPVQTQPAPPMRQQAGTSMQTTRPNLSRGQIRQIQSALNRDGFGVGRVDGIWGANTETALQKFQSSKGMAPKARSTSRRFAALNLNPSRFAQRARTPMRYGAPAARKPTP